MTKQRRTAAIGKRLRRSGFVALAKADRKSEIGNPSSLLHFTPLRASITSTTGNLATAPRLCNSRPKARQTVGDRRLRSSRVAARDAPRGK